MPTIEILDPRSGPRPAVARELATVPDLRGRVVAILNNRWTSMDVIADQLAKELKSKYGVADVIHQSIPITSAASDELVDEIANQADITIVGLAN